MGNEYRRGVLFDVDGTLVDTNYLHVLTWSRALRENGEWAPMNAIHRLVGMGGDQLVPHLLGHPDDAVEDARGRQYKGLIEEAQVFPGAADLLRRVHSAGLKVVLATSSPGEELEHLRRLIDAEDAIDAQTTSDDVESSKPEPDVFLAAMKAGGIDPRGTLVVGDSTWDIEAARAAGVGCVAVETGGFSEHELSEAGALHVYRDVREILQQFDTSPLALLKDP